MPILTSGVRFEELALDQSFALVKIEVQEPALFLVHVQALAQRIQLSRLAFQLLAKRGRLRLPGCSLNVPSRMTLRHFSRPRFHLVAACVERLPLGLESRGLLAQQRRLFRVLFLSLLLFNDRLLALAVELLPLSIEVGQLGLQLSFVPFELCAFLPLSFVGLLLLVDESLAFILQSGRFDRQLFRRNG